MPPQPSMAEEIRAGFYPGFERGWRRMELLGRALMLLMVGATLAGLLGGGPVSPWTRKATDGALEVEYAPVVRFGTPTGLTLRVPAPPGGDRAAVTLPGSLVERFGLQGINPRPAESQAAADGSMRLVFPVQPGAREAVVQLGGMPAGGGVMRLWARLDEGARASWSQLVLP